MAISVVNVYTASQNGGSNTLDVTGVSTSGANRCLLAALMINNQLPNDDVVPLTSVVLDSAGVNESFSFVTSSLSIITTDDGATTFWVLGGPSIVSAKTVTFTMGNTQSGSDNLAAGVVWELTGVDQTTPANNGANNAQGSGSPSITITTAVGDVVFGAAMQEDASTMAVDSPATEDAAFDRPASTNDASAAGHDSGAASPVTINFTANATDKHACSGCNIQAAAVAEVAAIQAAKLALQGVGI